MRDPISHALEILASGLRPYIVDRTAAARRPGVSITAEELPDAHAVLLFLWDHWNDVFRTELSFVERSLVSELREFRNRWAHQHPFSEQDVYRFLDDTERLLSAVGSSQTPRARDLRRNSLRRLYETEASSTSSVKPRRRWWTLAVCTTCTVAIDFTILYYFFSPATVAIALLVVVLLARIAYLLLQNERTPKVGPRECSCCNRIIYTSGCPYCRSVGTTGSLSVDVPLIRPDVRAATDRHVWT